jgi:plastocyanin
MSMSGVFLIVLMLVGSTSVRAAPTAQRAFVGCFNRLPDGALQFGALPSGELFALRGHTNLAAEHVNQLVRVIGDIEPNSNDNSAATLTILQVQTLAASCTSVLPSTTLEGVPGKVGEDAVAVPLTNTATEDRTTPGFQTEAAGAPSRSAQSASSSQGAEPPTAPPRPEQVGQSEAAANVNAQSVERSEIIPQITLGVTGTGDESETAHPVSQPTTGTAAPARATLVIVTINGNAVPKLSPPRVRIKTGQTVLWLNSTATIEEIIANPARETQLSDATIPTNVKPFDSGFLRPDHSFRYHFTAPGIYRYFCKVGDLNSSTQVLGEVDVER